MIGLSTDVGALKGLAYNENLHQKCSDIIGLSYDILANTNNIATKSGGGDINGKQLVVTDFLASNGDTWTYSNTQGGVIEINASIATTGIHTLIIDGVTIYANEDAQGIWMLRNKYEIKIPFSSYVQIVMAPRQNTSSNNTLSGTAHIYLNK